MIVTIKVKIGIRPHLYIYVLNMVFCLIQYTYGSKVIMASPEATVKTDIPPSIAGVNNNRPDISSKIGYFIDIDVLHCLHLPFNTHHDSTGIFSYHDS